MMNLVLIWSLFAFIFFWLGVYHFIQSRRTYPPFNIEIKETNMNSFFNATATNNKKRIELFIDEFNEYINTHNKINKHVNRLAFGGYMASTIVAIFSLLIELKAIPIK